MKQHRVLAREESDRAPDWAAEWVAHFLTVASSLGVLCVIAAICNATITVDVDRLPVLLEQITFPETSVAPEPAERTAYVASLIVIPVFMLLVHSPLRTYVSRLSPQGVWAWFVGSVVAMLSLLALGGLGDGAFYWRGCLVYTNPPAFLVATITGGVLSYLRLPDVLSATHERRLFSVRDFGLATAVVVFVALTSVLRIFPATDSYVADTHFEAVFFTSTQVSLGATLLVDLPHQYGLYPEFLAPVFRVLGGITVSRFTAVMAVLQAVAYVLWLGALFRVMRTRWMAMLTFLGAFSLASFLVPLFVIEQGYIPYYDPYFQYFPVRFLFPAIAVYAIAAVAEHDRFEKRLWRYVPSLILGMGILWNADAGLPALGAWVSCLCLLAVTRRNVRAGSFAASVSAVLRVLVESFASAAVAVIAGLIALALKSGEWPDPGMNLQFQRIFYGLGFYMLPMPVVHSWLVWAAVVMAALSYGIFSVSAVQDDQRRLPLRSTLFGWAVLACGLFAYYQGRSHDWVFPVVLPFAFAFLGVAIDRLFLPMAADATVARKWRLAGCMLGAAFVVALGSGAVSAWWADQLLWKLVLGRWNGLKNAATCTPEPPAFVFAKSRLSIGDTVLILSNHAGVYHAETQTKSPLPMSLIELILRNDRDEVLRKIAESERLFIDRSVLSVKTPNTNHETNLLISQEVAKHFLKVGESRDGYLLEVERRPLPE